MILTLFFVLYSVKRALAVTTRDDVIVNEYLLMDHYDDNTIFAFQDYGFKVAFGVESYRDKTSKDDPDFVEWEVILRENKKGTETVTPLTTHKCLPEDFKNFYPTAKAYRKKLSEVKDRTSLYCIDDNQDINVYGQNENTDYRRLELNFIPCQSN